MVKKIENEELKIFFKKKKKTTYVVLHSGPEGVEPSTRSFGDFRSTAELRPYEFFYCPNNKPDSV